MGKSGKKQKNQRNRKDTSYYLQEEENDDEQQQITAQLPHSNLSLSDDEQQFSDHPSPTLPSKFSLYQQSVQSPKGDISYLQKFFLTYVGGRGPLHLQEDFCGTALLSTKWLRSDSRRTAIGLDLDAEALDWCMENNVNKIGADISSRIFLYHGNVLHPNEAILVKSNLQNIMQNVTLEEKDNDSEGIVEPVANS